MFNERQAAHAAAYLLMKAGAEGLPQGKLMSLLYLSDREALRQTPFSITDDQFASARNGLVLLNIHQLMKGKRANATGAWAALIEASEIFENERKVVWLKLRKPTSTNDLGALSQNDRELMDSVWGEHGGKDALELAEHTRGLEEWEAPGKRAFKEISLARILKAAGRPKEEVDELVEFRKEQDEADQVLASLSVW